MTKFVLILLLSIIALQTVTALDDRKFSECLRRKAKFCTETNDTKCQIGFDLLGDCLSVTCSNTHGDILKSNQCIKNCSFNNIYVLKYIQTITECENEMIS